MRRIAIALTLVAAVVGIHACAADAPTAPRPGSGGGTTSSALSIQLFTSNANPSAGTCTLIEAVVTLNGSQVPDGSSVNFSTDFGAFGQNGLPLVSVVTTNGSAVTALCGGGAGTAKVKAQATVSGKTNSATITISFQPSSSSLPFVSSCSPSFGPKEGGTVLTLNGGRFFGTPSSTRIQFTANGITRDGIVTSVTSNAITVQTPGFPEIGAPTVPAAITLTLGTYLPTPVVLSLPNCFAYGSADSGTPTVTAILPSSGPNDGHTRVTIVGSGFSTTGVQVFFGTVEATVVSVTYNQIVVLSPPAFGAGQGNLNQTVPVTVKNIASGIVSNDTVTFTYTVKVLITAVSGNVVQRIDLPFSQVTIYGQGFQAPVAVSLAGVAASIVSVSATEVVVLPTLPFVQGCANITGAIQVTNINTGDSADSGTTKFTYVVPKPVITGVSPSVGAAGISVTITGSGFPLNIADTEVKFGAHTAFVTSLSAGSIVATVPPGTVTTAPACTGGNPGGTPQNVETVDVSVTDRTTTCVGTSPQAFSYQLPCVAPTPTVTPTPGT